MLFSEGDQNVIISSRQGNLSNVLPKGFWQNWCFICFKIHHLCKEQIKKKKEKCSQLINTSSWRLLLGKQLQVGIEDLLIILSDWQNFGTFCLLLTCQNFQLLIMDHVLIMGLVQDNLRDEVRHLTPLPPLRPPTPASIFYLPGIAEWKRSMFTSRCRWNGLKLPWVARTHHPLGGDECGQGASPWGAGGAERQTDLLSSHQRSVHLDQHRLRLLGALVLHHAKSSHRAALVLSKLGRKRQSR